VGRHINTGGTLELWGTVDLKSFNYEEALKRLLENSAAH